MNDLLRWISQPWPWYVSGMAISGIMFFLIFSGKTFAFSSNFRTICAACGAGKWTGFFRYEWKQQIWNLLFLVGSVAGGWIGTHWLSSGMPIQLSPEFLADLSAMGFAAPIGSQPLEIYGNDVLSSPWKLFILIIGGLLIGFGARYAGGCTSGHAITGLSNLQIPSLIVVIGFFVGGLIMTHFLYPFIFAQ
jgi:uncharacterized membrane protein YedE/YeeE